MRSVKCDVDSHCRRWWLWMSMLVAWLGRCSSYPFWENITSFFFGILLFPARCWHALLTCYSDSVLVCLRLNLSSIHNFSLSLYRGITHNSILCLILSQRKFLCLRLCPCQLNTVFWFKNSKPVRYFYVECCLNFWSFELANIKCLKCCFSFSASPMP